MENPLTDQQTETAPKAPNGAGKRLVAWLLFLIVALLVAAGGAGYQLGWPWMSQQWQRFEAVESDLAAIKAQQAAPTPDIAALATAAAAASVQSSLAAMDTDWQNALANLEARQVARGEEVARLLAGRMDRLEDQMDRLLAVDRRAWLGQEAIFLMRLASQRLLVARDIDSAQALLEQADGLLGDTGEPKFERVRLAIARDRASLTAVPRVDQVGLYAQLSALIDQVDQLQLQFEAQRSSVAASEGEAAWWQQPSAGWEAALNQLSDHLIVRRRSDEIAQLMTPQWAALARQNGRMLLEQAQIAMLTANQTLFEQSLGRAARFVALFAEQDAERVEGLMSDIRLLQGRNIAPVLPDLIEARSLLDKQIDVLDDEVSTE